MKIPSWTNILTSAVILLAPALQAQSPFQLGTNALAVTTNLNTANTDFARSLAANPTDPGANVYYAMTSLLLLPSLSSGSSFLTDLGVSSSGRNVYDWKAHPPKSAGGRPEVPSGFNADQVTSQLRENVLPALVAAQTNLAQITSASIQTPLFLPAEVTHLGDDVYMDYGDVLMTRALLNAAEAYIYVLNSWNFNATVGSVSNIIATDKSAGALLQSFPSLLTFATTADKAAASAAFVNAANLYFKASDFIHYSRVQGPNYLFNLAQEESNKELEYRTTLTNLVLSVTQGPQTLPYHTNITVSMAAFFGDTSSPRQYLPTIQGNTYVWNSFTNSTLGGVVQGLTETNLDQVFHHKHFLNAALNTPGTTLTVVSSISNSSDSLGVIRGNDGNLYGTTSGSYYGDEGTVFKVNPSTGQLTTLYNFNADTNYDAPANPNALIQGSDDFLYGTTQNGGSNSSGTIFRVSIQGQLKVLYSFGTEDPNEAAPAAALVQGKDGNLYGTTSGGLYGNTSSSGTVFGFSPKTMTITDLYDFSGTDGAMPLSPLIQGKDGNLYGTTSTGGANNSGNIFTISTGGTNFADLYDFGQAQDDYGSAPNGMVQGPDGNFYGSTYQGGTNDNFAFGYGGEGNGNGNGDGMLFRLSVTNQVGYLTPLYDFDEQNQDGYSPIGSLIPLGGNNFCGLTAYGGANDRGTVFTFNTSGAISSVVWFDKDNGDYSSAYYQPGFSGPPPGGFTEGADGNLYAATPGGGSDGNGAVIKLSISIVTAPDITTEPTSQTVGGGANASFTVAASGSGTLAYQWQFNGNNISGATSTALNLTKVGSVNSGTYTVVVKGSGGSITSDPAILTVDAPPSITKQPANASAFVAGSATFAVTAAGSGLTYQWWFTPKGAPADESVPLADDGFIYGSTSNELTVNFVTKPEAGSYFVLIQNSQSINATSAVVTLTVNNETTHPSATIKSPVSGSRTNQPTLQGSATDLVNVAGVPYWITNLNNAAGNVSGTLTPPNNTTSFNWNISSSVLSPGTNVLVVQSSNYAGLTSPKVISTFFYRQGTNFQLTINSNFMGSVSGSASVKGDLAPSDNASLWIGERYTLTAKPSSPVWYFSGWETNNTSAGVSSTLSFIMEPGFNVTANFASNYWDLMAGRYDGLFAAQDPAAVASSGLIENLVLTTNGVYSGKLYLAGTTNSLAGSFNRAGQAIESITNSLGVVALNLAFPAEVVSPREITGAISGTNSGEWIATNVALYAATTNTNNWPSYTILLPQDPSDTSGPPSYGYALMTNTGSTINMGFALADGTIFSHSEPINELNEFPIFANLYKNPGLLMGVPSLSAAIFGAVPRGGLIWIKPTQKSGLYSNAFSTGLTFSGSPWTNSPAALANFTNAMELTISGGGLSSNLTTTVKITASSGALTRTGGSTNFISGALNKANGQLSVTFRNTSGKTVTASAALLENGNPVLGGGFFSGTNSAGTIMLMPSDTAN